MKKWILGIGISVMVIAGCASMTPVSHTNQANLVLTQVVSTLESVDILLAGLNESGQSPQALKITTLVVKSFKPQILGWIDLIDQLKASDAQYTQGIELKSRMDEIVVKIDKL